MLGQRHSESLINISYTASLMHEPLFEVSYKKHGA